MIFFLLNLYYFVNLNIFMSMVYDFLFPFDFNQMISGRIKMKNVLRNQGNMAGWSSVVDHQRLSKSNRVLFSKNAKHHVSWRLCCKPVSVEEGSSSTVTETFAKDEESMSEDSPEEAPRPLSSDEVKITTNQLKEKMGM